MGKNSAQSRPGAAAPKIPETGLDNALREYLVGKTIAEMMDNIIANGGIEIPETTEGFGQLILEGGQIIVEEYDFTSEQVEVFKAKRELQEALNEVVLVEIPPQYASAVLRTPKGPHAFQKALTGVALRCRLNLEIEALIQADEDLLKALEMLFEGRMSEGHQNVAFERCVELPALRQMFV